MKLTCQRAVEIRDILRHCSAQTFLLQWRGFFDEIKVCFDDVKSVKNSLTLHSAVKSACLLLHEFLATCSSFPAASRELSLEKLPPLLSQILRFDSIDPHVFCALEAFLRHYPAVCSKQVEKSIKPQLVKLADQNCAESRLLAARCFSYLPLVGPAGEKRSKHAENWCKQISSVLACIFDCVKLLTAGFTPSRRFEMPVEGSDGVKSGEKIFAYDLQQTDVEKIGCRLDFCLQTVAHTIGNGKMLDLHVKLPLHSFVTLLEFFDDGLKLEKSMRCEVRQVFVGGYAKFCDVFALVPILAKFDLVPRCHVVCSTLESSLHRLASFSDSTSPEISALKCSIYRILTQIVKNLGISSKIDLFAAKFWPKFKAATLSTVFDGRSAVDVVKVDEKLSHVTGSANRKKRKKSAHADSAGDDNLNFVDQFTKKPENFENRCKILVGGLQFLTDAVSTCGSVFKPALYADLQRTVCKLLLSILSTGASLSSVGPYKEAECRLALLRLLRATVFVPHPFCAPAVQCFLRILTEFRVDPHPSIRGWCECLLLDVNGLTKPRVASLQNLMGNNDNWQKSAIDESKSSEENGQEIMETLNRIIGQDLAKNQSCELKLKAVSSELNENTQNGPRNDEIEKVRLASGFEASRPEEDSPEPIVVNIDDDDDLTVCSEIRQNSVEDDGSSGISMISLKRLKTDADLHKSVARIFEPSQGPPNTVKTATKRNDALCAKMSAKNHLGSAKISTDRISVDLSQIDDLIADFVDAPADNFEDVG